MYSWQRFAPILSNLLYWVFSFTSQRLFSSTKPSLPTVALNSWANRILFRKPIPVPILYKVLPIFSSSRFSISGCKLKSLIYLQLTFVQGDRYESNFILLKMSIQFLQYHLLKTLSFFQCTFLDCQITGILYAHVWVFYFISIGYVSVFIPISYCFYYYGSTIYIGVWNGNPSSIILIARDFLWSFLSGSFWFLLNFKNAFLFYVENVRILIWIALTC